MRPWSTPRPSSPGSKGTPATGTGEDKGVGAEGIGMGAGATGTGAGETGTTEGMQAGQTGIAGIVV